MQTFLGWIRSDASLVCGWKQHQMYHRHISSMTALNQLTLLRGPHVMSHIQFSSSTVVEEIRAIAAANCTNTWTWRDIRIRKWALIKQALELRYICQPSFYKTQCSCHQSSAPQCHSNLDLIVHEETVPYHDDTVMIHDVMMTAPSLEMSWIFTKSLDWIRKLAIYDVFKLRPNPPGDHIGFSRQSVLAPTLWGSNPWLSPAAGNELDPPTQ